MKRIHYIALLASVVCASLLVSCSSASIPENFTEGKAQPTIYPDYAGVTVPCNIAPLNFAIENEADDYVTRIKSGNEEWVIGGQSVQIDPSDWQTMKQASDKISVEVFTCSKDQWTRHKSFDIMVSKDSIDPYISYRLISPSYVTYENLTLNQRCLENFDESLIYGNMINTNEEDGRCINCHNYQNYDPNRMQFHVRCKIDTLIVKDNGQVEHKTLAKGGTLINYDGKVEKIDMSAVYPTWHPKAPLIAYSTNHTGQTFHTFDTQKIEVQDTYSDLILYDLEKHEIQPLECDTNDLDCFPFWDPAGEYLYYCSAHYEQQDSASSKEMDLIQHYEDVHYNLYRRSFDLATHNFGPRELVYDCGDTCSATLPRISPDGRYLLFTLGKYGVFHIWHNSSDLYLMDLKARQTRCMTEVNSPDVESYHSWSSNGKWIIFSSRRYDGNFTRPFIAHLNDDGTFTRPFELPQEDPRYHQMFLRSYNIPEFMTGPVTIKPQDWAAYDTGDTIKAKMSPNAPKSADVTTSASQQTKKAEKTDTTSVPTKQTDGTTGATQKQ